MTSDERSRRHAQRIEFLQKMSAAGRLRHILIRRGPSIDTDQYMRRDGSWTYNREEADEFTPAEMRERLGQFTFAPYVRIVDE